MKTSSIGRQAETAVARQLTEESHQVLSTNWRRRRCEIDIVSKKDGVVYFTEVKYRSSSGQGSGFEYITRAKQQQMIYAADVWIAENDWSGDYRLLAASVTGPDFGQINIVEV